MADAPGAAVGNVDGPGSRAALSEPQSQPDFGTPALRRSSRIMSASGQRLGPLLSHRCLAALKCRHSPPIIMPQGIMFLLLSRVSPFLYPHQCPMPLITPAAQNGIHIIWMTWNPNDMMAQCGPFPRPVPGGAWEEQEYCTAVMGLLCCVACTRHAEENDTFRFCIGCLHDFIKQLFKCSVAS